MVPLALIWVCQLIPSTSSRCGLLQDTSCAAQLPARPTNGLEKAQWLTIFIITTGTTYSCVATYEGTNVEIIANEQGSFTTPSFVSFTESERLIGEAAKNQAAMNPVNTVFDVK